MSGKGKRGQTYHLNLAGSDTLASDGRCNWHVCPKCYTRPKTNRAFWDRKGETNMARDRRVNRQLRQQGWRVIRIWQHSLKKSPSTCLSRLRRTLYSRGSDLSPCVFAPHAPRRLLDNWQIIQLCLAKSLSVGRVRCSVLARTIIAR